MKIRMTMHHLSPQEPSVLFPKKDFPSPDRLKIRNRAAAFTLIEMLVVIAIIALLTSLVFPAISKSIKSARSAKSLGNLRQIGLAIQMYALENQAKYPYNWSEVDNTTWRDLLYPYLNTKDDSPGSIYISPTSVLRVEPGIERASTYALNHDVTWVSRQQGMDVHPPVALHSVQNPTQLILAADTGQSPSLGNSSFASFNATSGWWYWNPNPGPWLDDPIEVVPPDPETGTEPGGSISYRDRDHAACLMADGSTRRFKRGTITKRNITFLH